MAHEWMKLQGMTYKCKMCHALEDFGFGTPVPTKKVTVFIFVDKKMTKESMTCEEYQVYQLMRT